MQTLFQAITGGDWPVSSAVICEESWFITILWYSYIAFVVFGLLYPGYAVPTLFCAGFFLLGAQSHTGAASESLKAKDNRIGVYKSNIGFRQKNK